MDQIPLNTHYDRDMDVFYAWISQPPEVLSVEPEEGIVLRFDARTNDFVGYTVLDFSRRYETSSPDEVSIPSVPKRALIPLRAQLCLIREVASMAA